MINVKNERILMTIKIIKIINFLVFSLFYQSVLPSTPPIEPKTPSFFLCPCGTCSPTAIARVGRLHHHRILNLYRQRSSLLFWLGIGLTGKHRKSVE